MRCGPTQLAAVTRLRSTMRNSGGIWLWTHNSYSCCILLHGFQLDHESYVPHVDSAQLPLLFSIQNLHAVTFVASDLKRNSLSQFLWINVLEDSSHLGTRHGVDLMSVQAFKYYILKCPSLSSLDLIMQHLAHQLKILMLKKYPFPIYKFHAQIFTAGMV